MSPRRGAAGLAAGAAAALLALSACSPAAAAAAPAEFDTRVVELTPDNFDRLTGSGEWLLDFYAPWCGHCKRLAPEFDKAAARMRGNGVRFGKVDASAHRALGARFGVSGYPTLLHVAHPPGGRPEGRRANVGHDEESLRVFAAGGWRQTPPTPELAAAFAAGGGGGARLGALALLDRLLATQQPLADALGAPLVAVQFAYMMAALLTVTMSIIGVALYLGPRKRHDD